jgi:hypothetical protein
MEDVGRAPAELTSAVTLEPTTVPTLDGWIEGLMACKQLPEIDVQRLCEKVGPASPPCQPQPQRRGRWSLQRAFSPPLTRGVACALSEEKKRLLTCPVSHLGTRSSSRRVQCTTRRTSSPLTDRCYRPPVADRL